MNVNNKSRRFRNKNVSVYYIGLASETEIIRLTNKGKQWHVLCVPRSCKQVEAINGLGSGLVISLCTGIEILAWFLVGVKYYSHTLFLYTTGLLTHLRYQGPPEK